MHKADPKTNRGSFCGNKKEMAVEFFNAFVTN